MIEKKKELADEIEKQKKEIVEKFDKIMKKNRGIDVRKNINTFFHNF